MTRNQCMVIPLRISRCTYKSKRRIYKASTKNEVKDFLVLIPNCTGSHSGKDYHDTREILLLINVLKSHRNPNRRTC